jgi:glycosyltransferase involved in cell wall biosynthesis
MTQHRDKLRILHLALSLNAGGTEKLVIEMVRALRERAEVAVCCLDEAGDWAAQLTDIGIQVTALHRRAGFHPSLGGRVGSLANRFRADVLHCHHYSPFVYGMLGKLRRPTMRIVYTEHGRLSDAPPGRKRRAANVLLGRLPGDFFAVSNDLRLHMIAAGFPGQRVGVIHNGISLGTSPTAEERVAARRRLGLDEGHVVVGTIARLDPVKDLGTLIRAFRELAGSHPRSRLVIIGDGPERGALERLVSESEMQPAVVFAGQRNDARTLLPAFDVFANCSITEGISITILEAMAACLPVVATRVGGNGEVVVEGQTGLLTPARDARSLAAALRALLDDDPRRIAFGLEGRRRVESSFSLETMVAAYLECYAGRS